MAKVTLQDIADAVGVSRMTVSNAFNRPDKLSTSLRATILQTATQLGYGGPDPSARALARGRSGTVGLLLTDSLGEAFRDPVSTEFLVAVGDALAENSLALTLVATAGDNPPMGPDLPMDGAIVFVCDPRVDLAWLRHRGTPVVTVDQTPTKGVPAVNVDDAGGARAAAQHLVDLGHRSIGIVTVGEDLTGRIRPADQRSVGWRKALTAAGVEPVVAHANPRPVTAAYDASLELLDRPGRPTALLCFSDVFAAQAVRAAEDLGLSVPADLSVVGYDDADFASTFRPALTTVRQQVGDKGRAAVTALLSLIEGKDPEPHTVLRTELVIRESTGPVPAGPPGSEARAMSRGMTYRHLGRSGLLVSPIGLGTMGFGHLTDESTSVAILGAALDAGINLVDTADVYGGPQTPDMARGYGHSEEIIGRWLSRTGRRDDIVLATKVYQPMGLGPNDRRLSAYHLLRACEASLRRLQTDHIDLYQMHHVDRATPWDEIWQAMEQLVRQGKISYVGSSNFAGWDIATAQAEAGARRFVGLSSEQSLYNLAVRAIEQEVIPALRHLGIGLIAYSPLHAGLLTGVLIHADSAPAADPRTEDLRDQLNSYEALCAELGATPTQVALAWVLSNPVTSAAIVGPASIGQLDADLAALTTHLEPAALRALDEIFPGPGEAPQSYAW